MEHSESIELLSTFDNQESGSLDATAEILYRFSGLPWSGLGLMPNQNNAGTLS
jgi:hypothetical protein